MQNQQPFQIMLTANGEIPVNIGTCVITNGAHNPHTLHEQSLGQAPIWHDGPLPECKQMDR